MLVRIQLHHEFVENNHFQTHSDWKHRENNFRKHISKNIPKKLFPENGSIFGFLRVLTSPEALNHIQQPEKTLLGEADPKEYLCIVNEKRQQ
ncbi:MAG TPA: hypothetical protein VGK25_00530 [Ignavibacteria bacterium]|jgi:hypothetical protein